MIQSSSLDETNVCIKQEIAFAVARFSASCLIIVNLIEISFAKAGWDGDEKHFFTSSFTLERWEAHLSISSIITSTTIPSCHFPMSQSFVFLPLMTSRFNTNCFFPSTEALANHFSVMEKRQTAQILTMNADENIGQRSV